MWGNNGIDGGAVVAVVVDRVARDSQVKVFSVQQQIYIRWARSTTVVQALFFVMVCIMQRSDKEKSLPWLLSSM